MPKSSVLFAAATLAASVSFAASTSSASSVSLAGAGGSFGDLPSNFGIGNIDFTLDIWDSLTGASINSRADLVANGTGLIADRFSVLEGDAANDPNPGPFRSAVVDFNATVTLTYLGSEAGFGNSLLQVGGLQLIDPIFSNYNIPTLGGDETSTVGSSFSFNYTPSGDNKLSIAYCTDRNRDGDITDSGDGCISNDGSVSGNNGNNLEVAISKLFQHNGQTTALLFFGDGVNSNDSDLDDMVIAITATPIPLPAGFLLMGTALAGLGVAARRRRG